MIIYLDVLYYEFLNGLFYMMFVLFWFYINLFGYNKNWFWCGDDLWFYWWQQVIFIDNLFEFIQIIFWNDFGELYYIGLLDERQYDVFDIGKVFYNYVRGMLYDGWCEMLFYYIFMYKLGIVEIDQEFVVMWYCFNFFGVCDDGGIIGDIVIQLYFEYLFGDLLFDKIYFDVFFISLGDVVVSIGGVF